MQCGRKYTECHVRLVKAIQTHDKKKPLVVDLPNYQPTVNPIQNNNDDTDDNENFSVVTGKERLTPPHTFAAQKLEHINPSWISDELLSNEPLPQPICHLDGDRRTMKQKPSLLGDVRRLLSIDHLDSNGHCSELVSLLASCNTSAFSFSSSRSPALSSVARSLPNYIRDVPSNLVGERLEHILNEGAFIILDLSLRDALLESYRIHVHRWIPLFDFDDLVQKVTEKSGVHRVSLLLLQVIMFAASAYTDSRHFQTAEYPSRDSARRIFFQRSQILYDHGYEDRPVVLYHCILLIAHSTVFMPKFSLLWNGFPSFSTCSSPVMISSFSSASTPVSSPISLSSVASETPSLALKSAPSYSIPSDKIEDSFDMFNIDPEQNDMTTWASLAEY